MFKIHIVNKSKSNDDFIINIDDLYIIYLNKTISKEFDQTSFLYIQVINYIIYTNYDGAMKLKLSHNNAIITHFDETSEEYLREINAINFNHHFLNRKYSIKDMEHLDEKYIQN